MDRRRLAVRAGLLAPPVGVGGVLLAALLAPGFEWWGGTLSHLGEVSSTAGAASGSGLEALVFNGSLVLAGLLGLPFAHLCYRFAIHPLQRTGAASLFVAFLALAGTGVFSQPSQWHLPALVVQVLATAAALWIYGAGTVNAGRPRFGGATVVLGLSVAGLWLAWETVVGAPGTAVPAFASVLALCGWTFAEAAATYHATEGRSIRDGLRDAVTSVTSDPAD